MKKKENIIIIVMLVVLVLAVIGVSYAAFSYSKTGTKINSITTGKVTMTYTESDNVIKIDKALPTTDETGKVRLKEGEYFDFTVSSEIVGDININYEISAKDVTDSGAKKIDGSNIKLYLTRLKEDGKEEELMSPETYNEEGSSNEYTGRPTGEMSLYQGSMNSSETNKYRLRMYVDEKYNPQGDGGNLTFSIKINVYGKDGDVISQSDNAVELVKTKVNPEDLDYATATSEQQKEMWTFSHPETEQTEALTDYRYIGKDPNNYVTFNDETWRIIGVFTVDDGMGNKEERLKIIRAESIGSYPWDNKNSTVGGSSFYGINNWPDASLNYLLNSGHESEAVGGSLYWNSGSGTCYSSLGPSTKVCDFTETGLKEEARNMIESTLWHLGEDDVGYTSAITSQFYSAERNNYNSLSVERDFNWIGNVALIYASDYGYSTSGGSIIDRNSCLNKELFNWKDSDYSDCYNNSWLHLLINSSSVSMWLLGPRIDSIIAYINFDQAFTNHYSVSIPNGVHPTVYLKSNVRIIEGDGSVSNPYILQE